MNLIKQIVNIINRISLYAAYTAALAGSIMMILILLEIIRRTFFDSSFLWTFEISSWLLVGFAFLGQGYTLQSEGHVRVNLLSSRFSKRAQIWMDMALSLVGASVFTYISVFVCENMISNYEIDARGLSIIEPPIYLMWAAAFVGLSIFSLQFFGVFLQNLIKLNEKGNTTNG